MSWRERQREIARAGAELLVDLLDAQPRVGLDERRELLRQRLEVLRTTLGTTTAARAAHGRGAAGQRNGRRASRPVAGKRRLERVERCAASELRDLRHEPVNDLVHLLLEGAHAVLAI